MHCLERVRTQVDGDDLTPSFRPVPKEWQSHKVLLKCSLYLGKYDTHTPIMARARSPAECCPTMTLHSERSANALANWLISTKSPRVQAGPV